MVFPSIRKTIGLNRYHGSPGTVEQGKGRWVEGILEVQGHLGIHVRLQVQVRIRDLGCSIWALMASFGAAIS